MENSAPQPAGSMVVLIVDDHPLIRSALVEVLHSLVGRVELLEAAKPEEGFQLLAERPDTDLIFLDLAFSGQDGLGFVRRFRAAAPAVPLVVYTMCEDVATLGTVLADGASAVVPKTHSKKLLQKALEIVMEGGIYAPPELARSLAAAVAAPARHQPAAEPASMSELQWRIVELIAQGLPNKEIARRLGLAASTVKNQLTVVFDRLQVSNRTQAAIAVRALGLSRRY